MTAQIRGLNMATKNANDGLSMLAVIENATNDVTDMLQRIRELAIQAANDTNGSVDRAFLQEEVSQLIQEIDRVATQTQYNGQVLLDGSFQNKSIQVGTEAGQTVSFSVDSYKTNASDQASDVDSIATFANGALLDVPSSGNIGNGEGHAIADGADTYDLTDHSFTNPTLLTVYQDTNEGNGAVIVITGTGTDDSAISETFTLGNDQQTLTGSKLFKTVTSMTYSDGDHGSDAGAVKIGTAPQTLGTINLQTQQGAGEAISVIQTAIERVASGRATLGALQNRLEYTVSNLMNVAEFTTSARSRIEDADFAAESARLAKAQVLQQTGTAMLAQANAQPQLALSLIR